MSLVTTPTDAPPLDHIVRQLYYRLRCIDGRLRSDKLILSGVLMALLLIMSDMLATWEISKRTRAAPQSAL
jgi:hypothetical protein